MRKMMRRIVALVWMMCLLAGGACAEAGADFSAMLPLLDLTASAALRVGETPENITADGTLSQAFVYNFFLLGQSADASLGITADMLADPAAQSAYLSRAFDAKQPSLSGILAFEEEFSYIGVQPMASAMNDEGDRITLYGDLYQAAGPADSLTEEQYLQMSWLNHRVVAEMHRDAEAPGGWKLISLAFEAAIMLEDDTQDAFTQTMAEYVNADLGFSLQYPAVFTEDVLHESAGGVSGTLADGKASFYARRSANEQAVTLEAYVDGLAQQLPGAQAGIDEISLTGRVISRRADGQTQVDLVIVTSSWIYEAQLCYAPELADEFALYSEYMTNSFMADELGIG